MAAFTRTPTGVTNARTTPAPTRARTVGPFTVDDLVQVYGPGWRFDRRGGTWIAVDKDGHRYEAPGVVDLADRIAAGRTVCR